MQMAKALHCLESFAHGSGSCTYFHLFVSCKCGILTRCRHRIRDQQGWFTTSAVHSSAEVCAADASDALVDGSGALVDGSGALVDGSDGSLVPHSPHHAVDSLGADTAASSEHTSASHIHAASDVQNGLDKFHPELRSVGGTISQSHPDVDATSRGNVAIDVCSVSQPHDQQQQQQQQESSSTSGSSESSASQSQHLPLLESGPVAAMDGPGYDLIASDQSYSVSSSSSSSSSSSVAATKSGVISKPPLSLRERMSL